MELLDLEAIEDNLFRGRQPDTQLQRVFGGQVAAHALVAATRTVDPRYVVHSLHSYFLRPGDTAVPIVYDVDDVRDGRSFATRRVLARQHGRPIFGMTASFQVPEEGREHQDAMPDVPAPEDCVDLLEDRGEANPDEWRREWAALDIRYAGDSRPGRALEDPAFPARARLWMRVNGALPDDVTVDVEFKKPVFLPGTVAFGSRVVPDGIDFALTDPRTGAPHLVGRSR
jgi:acyl-CoA thioesterase-2